MIPHIIRINMLACPPGPISNPSQASFQAAFQPAQTDFWYFLTDETGRMYFAKTLEDQERNRLRARQ